MKNFRSIKKPILILLGIVCFLYVIGIPYGSEKQIRPVNPNATPAMRSVLNYIYDVRGRGQILSAQYITPPANYNEAEHVRTLTGKLPAFVEFDFLSFHKMPERKEYFLNFAKAWYRAGGLVGVCWHETSPELAVLDEGGLKHGTRKKMSQEQFADTIKEGTELNRRWLEHLDQAARWLKELQKAGVVVLWRPYHEMTGGWFWWGAKEPKSFLSLWKKAYERLTKHHQLNNLIWVWSASSQSDDYEAYLPRDFVDIIGIDLYYSSRDNPKFAQRAAEIQRIAKGKPIALTEVGAIPTLDILINQTDFTYFTVWGKGWLDNEHYYKPRQNGPGNSPAWIREVYAHPQVISKDEIRLR
ncbi:glycosyl hydrolase [uncultured Desulfobacter sp.]|uniref:glycosyl hydrolase n=1 Tax=uncultured Desulfobacter sp. TaxID=240139 RepID=UPI0029F53C89|nr:glycosyl hydrolase [uncultured Desulfobacter sp.]